MGKGRRRLSRSELERLGDFFGLWDAFNASHGHEHDAECATCRALGRNVWPYGPEPALGG